MSEFPSFSRMPGSDGASAADFEPNVVSGLRLAGAVLLVTAVLEWLSGTAARYMYASVIVNALLGIQLLRLQHAWKLWALIRAWIGVVLSLIAWAGSASAPLLWMPLGAGALYCLALILVLTGVPSTRALLAGRVMFAASVVLYIAGWWLIRKAVEAAVAAS